MFCVLERSGTFRNVNLVMAPAYDGSKTRKRVDFLENRVQSLPGTCYTSMAAFAPFLSANKVLASLSKNSTMVFRFSIKLRMFFFNLQCENYDFSS